MTLSVLAHFIKNWGLMTLVVVLVLGSFAFTLAPVKNFYLKQATLQVLEGYGYFPVQQLISREEQETLEVQNGKPVAQLVDDSTMKQVLLYGVFGGEQESFRATRVGLYGGDTIWVIHKGNLQKNNDITSEEQFIRELSDVSNERYQKERNFVITYLVYPVVGLLFLQWVGENFRFRLSRIRYFPVFWKKQEVTLFEEIKPPLQQEPPRLARTAPSQITETNQKQRWDAMRETIEQALRQLPGEEEYASYHERFGAITTSLLEIRLIRGPRLLEDLLGVLQKIPASPQRARVKRKLRRRQEPLNVRRSGHVSLPA